MKLKDRSLINGAVSTSPRIVSEIL